MILLLLGLRTLGKAQIMGIAVFTSRSISYFDMQSPAVALSLTGAGDSASWSCWPAFLLWRLSKSGVGGELQRVRLSKKEHIILASVVLRDEVRSESHSAEELYQKLPTDVRDQLSRLDFLDFLDKCCTAGVADVQESGKMILKPTEQAVLRITVQ